MQSNTQIPDVVILMEHDPFTEHGKEVSSFALSSKEAEGTSLQGTCG